MFELLLVTLLPFAPLTAFAKDGKKVRTIYIDDRSVTEIRVNSSGTVLSFPFKPTKVILGKQKSFDLVYVENDVAVAPLSAGEKSNLFVYLLGKRYAFYLTAASGTGDDIVLVRDASEPRPQTSKGKKS